MVAGIHHSDAFAGFAKSRRGFSDLRAGGSVAGLLEWVHVAQGT